MKLRALVILALLGVAASAARAEVRVQIRGGRRVLINDGPARIGASDDWLASRVARSCAYDGLIAEAAVAHSVDPKLVKSVMLIESGFNPAAVSRKGARGLMQLMPEVAVLNGVRDVHDPAQNIAGGVRHLAYLLGLYAGDVVKSLAAYNAGEAAVEKYHGVPPYEETQLYVRKTLAAYYGKSTLGGGFGRSTGETFRRSPAPEGRPVQWTRDSRNRVVLTTRRVRPVARRLG
jgi:soluble lytic murein transglycosylase-like protein